jgi:hypothetical protein
MVKQVDFVFCFLLVCSIFSPWIRPIYVVANARSGPEKMKVMQAQKGKENQGRAED